ncbi:MAG TPA: hypothetical protein VLT15_07520 [Acidimicrobiia bacterium]|nr:hypothetical protein [Acidimicrobiia bacterium]
MRDQLTSRFVRLLAAAALINLVGAQILHEVGHWLVLTVTGRSPVWGLTAMIQLSDRAPVDPTGWSQLVSPTGDVSWLYLGSLPSSDAEWAIMLAAGPLMQVLAVGVGLLMAARAASPRARAFGLLLALVNGLSHGLYQMISSIRGGGSDEALLAEYTGLPWWLFAVVFGAAAAAGFVVAVRMMSGGPARRSWVGAAFLGSLATGPLFMRLQGLMIDGVDRGDALYSPILGFTLPIVVLTVLGVAGMWWVFRRWPIAAMDSVAT